jgi:hypothetical protein
MFRGLASQLDLVGRNHRLLRGGGTRPEHRDRSKDAKQGRPDLSARRARARGEANAAKSGEHGVTPSGADDKNH